jgi:hypothetical protein
MQWLWGRVRSDPAVRLAALDELDRALDEPDPVKPRWGVALRRRDRDTPVAALALHEDEDESLREHARSALDGWPARKTASARAPTPDQRERVRANLGRLALSPNLERVVRFHAGL